MSEDKKIRVLLADDEEYIRNSMIRRLKNFEVIAFSTAEALLNHLQSYAPGKLPLAVITDYVFPEMTGEALVKELLKSYPKLPIIVISGEDMRGSIQTYGQGAYAVMSKPVDYNELIATLRELESADKVAIDIAQNLKNITEFDCCLVWEMDKKDYPNYHIIGWAGIDRNYLSITNMQEGIYPRLKKLHSGEPMFLAEVSRSKDYLRKDAAQKRGWVSLITLPINREGKLMGWIDCYKNEKHDFGTEKRKNHQLTYLQSYAALAGEALHARKQVQQSRVIHETNQALVGMLQESVIYDTILQKAIDTTGGDCGWIYNYKGKEQIIELKAFAGQGSEKADKKRKISKGGITGEVARKGVSSFIRDVTKSEENFKPEMHIKTPGLLERAIMAVPLRRGERTLGVITVKSKYPDFFSRDDLQLLTGLASIAAVNMERNKLTHHLQGISRMAQDARDFDKLAEYVIHAVHDLIDAEVNLWMMSGREDEGDNYLRIIKASDPKVLTIYKPIPTAPGTCISAKALYTRKHVIVRDLKNYDGDPPFINTEAVKEFSWRSFMAVPLLGKNAEHLGVISLLSREVNKFAEDDGILVQHFANQAALALQEQRHIQILQELANTGEQLTVGQADAVALLEKVVKLAHKIAKAELAVLYPYDPIRQLYYDNERIVHAGNLKESGKRPTQKPRDDGLAAFIRKNEALIVEEIENGLPFTMSTGLRKQKAVPVYSEAYQKVSKFIQEAKFIERENIRSFIGVSLRAEEQVKRGQKAEVYEVAVLYFNFRAPRRFSSQELQVIDIFCHQVANVIYRNRLFYSLKKERELIEGVHQSTLNILEERDLRDMLEEIVNEAVKLLNASGGKVYLTINGSRQDLRLEAMKNLPARLMKVGDKLTFGEGMSSKVIETKKPLIENNYKQYPNRIKKLEGYLSAVAEVPLLIDNEVIGVLAVFNTDDKNNFTQKDVTILEKLGAQAALAIYSVRAYQELKILNETGLQIAEKSSTPEQMGEKILIELSKVVEYKKATIQLLTDEYTERKNLKFNGYKKAGNTQKFCRPLIEDELVYKIYQDKRVHIISDTSTEPLWDLTDKDTQNVKSWVCIPLVYNGDVQGFIFLDHNSPGFYTERDRSRLELFALQAASGIYNASLEQQQLKSLSRFSQFLLSLDSNGTPKSILEEAIVMLTEVLTDYKVSFKLYTKDEDYLPQSSLVDAMGKIKLSIQPLSHKDEAATWVDQQKEVKLLPDDSSGISKNRKGSQLLGPLWQEGKVCGILEISSSQPFSDKNLKNFFSAMLALASEAMYRIHLIVQRKEAFERRFNPYIAGAPIRTPNQFYGRSAIIHKILDGIHQNNFIIEDERRIGKTSLLYQLKFQLEQSLDHEYAFYPVFLNIEATAEQDFWRHLRDSVYNLTGKVHPNREGTYDFHTFQKDLDEVLLNLENQIFKKKLIVVFLIDEVDKFKTYSNEELSKFRRLFQDDVRLRLIMAGVEVNRHLNDITSPWHNQLNSMSLKAMAKEEARKLISGPVRGIYTYESKAIDLILAESQCKPLAVQTICFNSINIMLNRLNAKELVAGESLLILKEDVEQAINNINV